MTRRACTVETHPARGEIERLLRENVMPAAVGRWIRERYPDDPTKHISDHVLGRHRRDHLGMPALGKGPLKKSVSDAAPAPPPPAASDRPSAKLGRDVTDDDIAQAMKRRFYDTIDQIAPDKVAEWLIEHEKAKSRVAPPRGRRDDDEDLPPEIADLRSAAARALGPSATRTSARKRTG